MPSAGVKPTPGTWTLGIEACAEASNMEQALSLLYDMRSRGLEATAAGHGAAIRACARSGCVDRAMFLLRDMAKRGLPPPSQAVANAIREVNQDPEGWRHSLDLYSAFTNSAWRFLDSGGEGGLGLDKVGEGMVLEGARLPPLLWMRTLPGLDLVCQATLEACANGGAWEVALEVLNTLRARGEGDRLGRKAYDLAMEACARGEAWDMVMLLTGEIHDDGVSLSRSAWETALEGCANTGSWNWAQTLLLDASSAGPDTISLSRSHYHLALRACASVGDKSGGPGAKGAAKVGLKFIQDMRKQGFLGGCKAEGEKEGGYLLAMQACVKGEDAWSALAILELMEDDGMEIGVDVRTAAMQACSGAGEWRAALSILDHLQEDRLKPGGEAYMAAMAACARGGVVEQALHLLNQVMLDHQGDAEILSAGYRGAIAACAEVGHWEAATKLLHEMRQDTEVEATIEEFNSAILACCRAGESTEALSILGDLSAGGQGEGGSGSALRPSERSYNSVMQVFAREGKWEVALTLLRSMQEEGGLTPGLISYSLAIDALAKGGGHWQMALELMEEMKRKGIRPSEVTYTSCMSACEKAGQWHQALGLIEEVKAQADLLPDPHMFSTAMIACVRVGRFTEALNILEEMRAMPGIEGPNVVNYNIVITAAARIGDWPCVLKLIGQMLDEDVCPNETTFIPPLDACARAGELPTALTILSIMNKEGVTPGVIAWTAAVTAACRAGDAAAATSLLDNMKEAGQPPNCITFLSAAGACRDSCSPGLAKEIVYRNLGAGGKPGARLDEGVFSFAVQACVMGKDWPGAVQVIKLMKLEGIKPGRDFYNRVLAGIAGAPRM
ncbi:unnamed protein product [Discosporangium mesarthrocarpum]